MMNIMSMVRIRKAASWKLMIMFFCLGIGREATAVEEKAEVGGVPLATQSPPEGNTTFIDGTTWCIAVAGAAQSDLQNALDWACGQGKADCTPIRSDGPCFHPNTLLAHASYAFNNYYQQNGNSDIACNFGGTAIITKNNPSYDRCIYDATGLVKSPASQLSNSKLKVILWKLIGSIVLLFAFCIGDAPIL